MNTRQLVLILFAITVATIAGIHIYTPIAPSIALIGLVAIYLATLIAIIFLPSTNRNHPRLLTYLLAFIGLLAILPVLFLLLGIGLFLALTLSPIILPILIALLLIRRG